MKELLELLDKLIELGKVYGTPGVAIGAFTGFSAWAVKVAAEHIVEDRKNEREHQRRLKKLTDQIERRKLKSRSKE